MEAQHLGTALEADDGIGIAETMAAGRQRLAHLRLHLGIDAPSPAGSNGADDGMVPGH